LLAAVSRKRWEILAASAVATSALALAIADPFRATPPATDAIAPVGVTAPPNAEVRPRIEVVFAVDTTGSMGGLIDGAKRKVWSIANALASGQPRPDVRVGLVAYRDLGDAYVVQPTPLTGDLDEVYASLQQFSADGGGDGPEHVNAALAQAIRQTQWSQDAGVLKLVFLVGDAPPHNDYSDGLNTTALAKEAAAKGITINTIRCGSDGTTGVVWQEIAAVTGGEFASIVQDGGVVSVATPYDAELQTLNAELADTVLGFGTAEDKARSDEKVRTRRAMASPAAAAAASYSAKAGRLNREDLVTAIEGGLSLDEVSGEALPEELRGLSRPEQEAVLEAKGAKRKETNSRILEVAKKRDAYLKESEPAAAGAGFDAQVFDMVKKQTSAIGVAY